jgi:hypothetical protein
LNIDAISDCDFSTGDSAFKPEAQSVSNKNDPHTKVQLNQMEKRIVLKYP